MTGVETLFQHIRQAGYKLTRPRQVVIEVLADGHAHMTAADIVSAVHQRAPDVGRASVYRTLDLLVRLGLVQISTLGSTTTTYMLVLAHHHHHLVCTRCHRTVEFDECQLAELEQALAEQFGFQVYGHLVEVYGVCQRCQGASP